MTDPIFLIDDGDRYSRLRLIGWWDQEKLARAHLLVVGAGALGNEVLKNLALLGVGTISIVDFDQIEHSNLTRSVLFRQRDCGRSKAEAAAAAVRDLNPDCTAIPLHANILTDVGLGLFRDVDVVIGCLDNREARLWVNRQCWKIGTPWVDAGIQEINGVVKVFVPPTSACYECGMTENDYRLINLRYSCPLLRQEDLQAGKVPTAPTISAMMAGLQTQEALKLLHGMPVEAGVAMIYNGVSNQFYKSAFQRREDCLSHESYPPPTALPVSAEVDTAGSLFEAVRSRGSWERPLQLHLDRDLVVAVECIACGHRESIWRVLPLVGMHHAHCKACGEMARPEFQHTVVERSELARQSLRRLGIPAYDIVRVSDGVREACFLLQADQQVGSPHAETS